ncbi:hydrogenase formation protein HypD [Anaeroarcus burkinensis]|uniref:hydrogenase formation protein HypD n=1 Tax=Anaeroarcus burkinensis TaxID=82376 RepID=UPI0003F4FF8E|nr:hydrogenase formation protein HypD [Anaeroarcus burkinensis]
MFKTPEEIRCVAAAAVQEIERLATRPLRLMEVCGTHTVAIFRHGLRQLLPEAVELVSGPGCPVCVTPTSYMDLAIAYAEQPGALIATFGDMLRVPGSFSSLEEAKSRGADIHTVYSPLESLELAERFPEKRVIFLGVGFETTAPLTAACVREAARRQLSNWLLLPAHKVVPPALSSLLQDPESRVDGLLLPGHVAVVTGTSVFANLPVPAVVAGFEVLDILEAIVRLVRQAAQGEVRLENAYRRVVRPEGNLVARSMVKEVYEPADSAWRGMGVLAKSGLRVRQEFSRWDAAQAWQLSTPESKEVSGCCCGEVLKGRRQPPQCPLFGRACTPLQPVGACMVSVEGVCAAWYKYGAGRWSP